MIATGLPSQPFGFAQGRREGMANGFERLRLLHPRNGAGNAHLNFSNRCGPCILVFFALPHSNVHFSYRTTNITVRFCPEAKTEW